MTSRELFEILIREHSPMLMVYLRTLLHDPWRVDDAFQETVLVAWRRLNDFDSRRPFAPWLRGIAVRVVMSEFRRNARQAILAHGLEHLESRMESIEQATGDVWADKLDFLQQCVRTLPDRYRDAVDLRYRRQLSLDDIASHLSISLHNLHKRLQRARTRLRDCIRTKLTVRELHR